MIVGLTGGIASGKSTVSSIFKEFGVEIIDADKVAKKLTETEKNKQEIAKIFGTDVIDENGNLIREKIRERAFGNKELLDRLNLLIHPQVIEYFKEKREKNSKNEIVIFDVPLLFETKMNTLCDKVIVVSIPLSEQIKRVMLRDKIDEKLAKKIIDKQLSLEYKVANSDIVIDNSGSLEHLKNQVLEVYKKLKDNVR